MRRRTGICPKLICLVFSVHQSGAQNGVDSIYLKRNKWSDSTLSRFEEARRSGLFFDYENLIIGAECKKFKLILLSIGWNLTDFILPWPRSFLTFSHTHLTAPWEKRIKLLRPKEFARTRARLKGEKITAFLGEFEAVDVEMRSKSLRACLFRFESPYLSRKADSILFLREIAED